MSDAYNAAKKRFKILLKKKKKNHEERKYNGKALNEKSSVVGKGVSGQ